MNQNGKVKAIYSWTAIVIALIFFWPVGVGLLIGRISVDKKAALTVGNVLNRIAIVSYVMAAVCVIACIGAGFEFENIYTISFFAVAGVVFQFLGKLVKADAENVKKYLSIIINGNEFNLNNIAAAMGKPYDTVRAEL